MTVDNRTEINNCDAVTGFTGDGPVDVDNTAGFVYEGTNAITTQHTNVDEHIYTTEDSLNTGTFSLDWSDSTVYLIVKDNLLQTAANGGAQFVLGDGTDRIGYGIGGNDDVGFALDAFWNAYKLDVTEIANVPYTNTYAGVLANLTTTAITEVGYGSVHLAKAQGNVDNIKLDNIRYIANASYAFTINAGTSGTPITMATVTSDSITNGWGAFANPLGSQYTFYAPTEWGEPAANANVFFTANDEQWTWQGGIVGVTNFPFRIVGNATDTIDVKWTNVGIVNVGTRAEFLAGDTNTNVMQFDNVSFTDVGDITYTTQSVGNRFADNCTYNNCGQVYFNTMDMDGATFNGTTNANGALLWDGSSEEGNQDNITFNSDGTGHGIEISLNTAATTTYDITGYEVTGYGGGIDTTTGNELFLVDNLLDGDVDINVTDGIGTFNNYQRAAGYTGIVTITQTVTLTLTGIETDSEVRIINLDDTTNFNKELTGSEQIAGVVTKVEIADGGSGYVIGDEGTSLTVVGGTGTAATITIDTVTAGAIAAVSINSPGSYTVNPPTPATTTGGTGTGCTLRLTIAGTFDYTYDAGLGVNIAIIVFHLNFREVRIEQVLPGVSSSIPIQQSVDRTYNNP